MARLGTANNPLRVQVNSTARAITVLAICFDLNWKAEVKIVPTEPEDLEDLDDQLTRSHLGWPVIKAKQNSVCPCKSAKPIHQCCLHDIGQLLAPFFRGASAPRKKGA